MSIFGTHCSLRSFSWLVSSLFLLNHLLIVNGELRRLPAGSTLLDLEEFPGDGNKTEKRSSSSGSNWNTMLDSGNGVSKGQFVSSKVQVTLNCEPEETVVNLNFTEPFRGVIQIGENHVPCRIRGDGRRSYLLHVPHNGCGTRHVVSNGSFFNTLFIRFHPSLEMEGDQLKTIVCKFGTGSIFVG